MAKMGFDYGLEKTGLCLMRKFRWLFKIREVCAESGTNCLPPLKSARPSLSFKELQAEHLNETLYFPGKPEWKPITLSLYDLKKNEHPVFKWLKKFYDPKEGKIKTPTDNEFMVTATLELYDGCGEVMEKWTYENCWPQAVEFGDLDMGSSEIVTCDITLRYARAYIEQ
jgi:hypothetical protein